MSVSASRKLVCCLMLALTPATLLAGDQPAAMLYSKGTVLVNGNPLPDSSAIAEGDRVETGSDSAATITASGSNVIMQPGSVLKFGANTISLEQGNVSVATSTGLVTTAATASATPAANTWTEYEVTNMNGEIEILSRTGNLNVNCGKETATLSDGLSVTSDSSGKCSRKKKTGAYPPASGNILDSPYWKYIAAAGGAGLLIWLLWPSPAKPASPSIP
jgi:hypothetical protein